MSTDTDWLRALLSENKGWHDGGQELVDPTWHESPGPDVDPKQAKWYQDVEMDRMNGCPVRVFLNRDGEILHAWVGHDGIDDAKSPEQVAAVVAGEVVANDDGFGLEPDHFHPVIRDAVWGALQNATRPFLGGW